MRCGKAKEWLSLAHDDCLPPDRTLALERHLERCPGCRAYREDLRLGSRLLRATEPRLSESFDWRLQLRLNRRLQEAARTAPPPWERERGARGWLRDFGLATAAGVVAAVGLGAWLLPGPAPMVAEADSGSRPAAATVVPTGDQTRLPLGLFGGEALGQAVSYGGRSPFRNSPAPGLSAWSGYGLKEDLRVIGNLRQENLRLRAALMHARREIQAFKAQQQSTDLETATFDEEQAAEPMLAPRTPVEPAGEADRK